MLPRLPPPVEPQVAGDPTVAHWCVEGGEAGLPLEHVVGWAEFCGLRIAVEPGVFVPRPRTELLVHEAAALGGPRVCVSGG